MARQFLQVLTMLLFIGATCDLKLAASEEQHSELVKENPSNLHKDDVENSTALPNRLGNGNTTIGLQTPNVTMQHLPYNQVKAGEGEIEKNGNTVIPNNLTMGKSNVSNFQEPEFQQTQKKEEQSTEQTPILSILSTTVGIVAFILIVLGSMFPPDCQSWKKQRSPADPVVISQNGKS
ncbi:unnamed protein product [Orchesella dallaii]|uniref:Uncharacterized protein n=1 Tax=Orchesella dallaii TaxID=48710 RepID=A0ABP1R4L1_9HEXA